MNKDDATKYKCEVLTRRHVNEEYLYKVELTVPLDDDDDGSEDDDEDDSDDDADVDGGKYDFVLVKNVPRYAIQFVNKPYSSDMFLRRAFRHEMVIPDDIMPDAWKNKDT